MDAGEAKELIQALADSDKEDETEEGDKDKSAETVMDVDDGTAADEAQDKNAGQEKNGVKEVVDSEATIETYSPRGSEGNEQEFDLMADYQETDNSATWKPGMSSPSKRGRKKGRGRGRGMAVARPSRGRGREKVDFIFYDSDASQSLEIKKKGVNVWDLPDLMVPFEHGWTREHVLRGTFDDYHTGGKKVSDVYYFAPKGKKIRSMIEVAYYLGQHNIVELSSKNFSFARCTLYKSPYDITRYSGGIGRPSPRASPSPKHMFSPDRAKPSVTDTSVNSSMEEPLGLSPLVDDKSVVSTKESSSSLVVTPKTTAPTSKAVAKKRTSGVKRTADGRVPVAVIKKPSMAAGFIPRLCGMECPGMIGKPPELHCKLCMCLFHPKCVGHTGSEANFICPECSRVKSSTPEKQDKVGVSPVVTTSASLPPLVPAPVRIQQPASLVTKTIIPPPPALTRASVPTVVTIKPPTTPNAISGHLITLPISVTSKLNMRAPLTLKIGGKDVQVPPSCLISTPDGVKVFLPPGVLNSLGMQSGPPRALNIITTSQNPQNMVVQNPTSLAPPPVHSTPIVIPEVRTLGKIQVQVSSRAYSGINPALCSFQKLHAGIQCLNNIFHYLPVKDKLRAMLVCKMWRDILKDQHFWTKLELRGNTVSNWEAATKFMKIVNTETLDMRGIQHCDGDKNRTWHQFTASLGELIHLKHIYFDQCPSQILQSAGDKLTGLQTLSAQFIMDAAVQDTHIWTTNAKLDLSKFGNMAEMQDLRLRAVCGLIIPSGLSALEKLCQLRYLSITTMKEIEDTEFQCLGSLTSLEELELGDCDRMASQAFQQIKLLTKLTRLRLEGRQKTSTEEQLLADSLSSLQKLTSLELIKFAVSEEILLKLKTMKQLKSLTLWPENGTLVAERNSAVYKEVQEMKFLETFEWAIMGDQIQGGKESEDGRHHQNDSVLLLKEDQSEDASDNTKLVNIAELMDKLCTCLSDTRIRVFRLGVPVLCP